MSKPKSDPTGRPTYKPLLSTVDNPYSPHTHWDEWYQWDTAHGYNTCALLDRVAPIEDDVDTRATADAMAEIVRYNLSGVHIIVLSDGN